MLKDQYEQFIKEEIEKNEQQRHDSVTVIKETTLKSVEALYANKIKDFQRKINELEDLLEEKSHKY
jgi:hypothetical protein